MQQKKNVLDYTPPPTLHDFMLDPAFARFVIGPLGSGKSFACIMELFRRAVEQEPDVKGVRPTRFAIIRNTLQQIKQTCLSDIRSYLEDLADFKVSDSTIYFNFPLPDGTRVASEWLLMPIDTQEDTRRLLSLQLTGVWASEFRELEYSIVAAALGRVGRYPSVARVAPTWQGLIAESNPFSEGSDWYENLYLELPRNWSFYRQPGGLSKHPEYVSPQVSEEYYQRLMEGHNEEWINVHVHAEFGDDLSGQPVYKRSFDKDRHVVEGLKVNPNLPLMIEVDLGRTPTALISQINAQGSLMFLEEIVGEDIGLTGFLDTMLRPKLLERPYLGLSVFCTIDPAGRAKSQLSEDSALDIFEQGGFQVECAITNSLDTRLRTSERLLYENRGSDPAIQIDPAGCPMLIKALTYEYKFKRRKTGDIEDKPNKNHPWSDLGDCFQYGCLGLQSNLTGKIIARNTSRIKPPEFTAAAWT